MKKRITFSSVKIMKSLAAALVVLLITGYSVKAQTDTKTLRIYAPASGSISTDSLVLWRNTDSTVYKVSPLAFAAGVTTNVLTVANDSIFSTVNGVLSKASLYSIDSSLYKTDGSLQGNRIVTFGGHSLTFATGGTGLYISGLPTGTTTDKLLTLNSTSGQVDTLSVAAALSGNSTNTFTLSKTQIATGITTDTLISTVNSITSKQFIYGQGRVACNGVTDVPVTDPSVTPTSTIIVTYVNLANSNTQSYMISNQISGSFNVHFGGFTSNNAYINYMVLP